MLMDLSDGRRLEVLVAGPENGRPLVYHYGTPSGAVPYQPWIDAATRRGLRTVVWSRPGYGDSTARPGRTVADIAADTAAVLDTLGAGRFVTVGKSGGGPHALACAALLPDRCAAATSIAGVGPYGADGLDWLAGMGPENIEEFTAALAGEEALTRFLNGQLASLATVSGADVAAAFGQLLSEVDRRCLTGGFAEYTAASLRRAVANGIAGWRDDDLAFAGDWGFPLDGVGTGGGPPVAIWQGGQDRMVPHAHGAWLAAHLPGAEVHLRPDEGHLSLVLGAFDEILDELVALAS
jgi:pimeloyl-ACP methyl ester carboxylesterase